MTKEIPIYNDTLCDLKWNYPIFNLSRGEFRNCCRTPPNKITEADLLEHGIDAFLNSPKQKASRAALIKGEKHPDCVSCWKLEDAGMKSPRQSKLQFWNHLRKADIIGKSDTFELEKLTQILEEVDSNDAILEASTPYMLELNLGNTCDLKCMYCNHHYSSQWATELIKWGDISPAQIEQEFPKAPSQFDKTFWEWFNTVGRHSLNAIGIIGGEPLITPDFYPLIEKLADSVREVQHLRDKKMKLWIVSNFNTPVNYMNKLLKHLPVMNELFEVQLYASMESTGRRAEYIRNGINWDRFNENIETILTAKKEQNLSFNFSFMPTVNILSISGTLEFIKYVEEKSRKYNMPIGITQNIVSFPNWQTPLILTPDFADYLTECVSYMKTVTDLPVVADRLATWDSHIVFLSKLADSIKNEDTDTLEKRKKFFEWFNTYDQRRKLDFLKTFPEYEEFYKLCEISKNEINN